MDTDTARRTATEAHDGQPDKLGVAYITHPAAVAERIRTAAEHISELGEDPTDLEVAAWLHDVVEDTTITEQDLTERGATNRQLELLRLLTHVGHEPRRTYVSRIATDLGASIVKLADNLHNTDPDRLAALNQIDPDAVTRLTAKYAKDRAILDPTGELRAALRW